MPFFSKKSPPSEQSFSPPEQTPDIKRAINEIEALQARFDLALETAIKSGKMEDIEIVQALKEKLETKVSAMETRLNPFEQLLHLKEQYENQKSLLVKTNLLETLSTRELGIIGIKGIDGKEYPFPTLEQVTKRLEAKEKIVKEKVEQGFSKLLLTPFGMSLDVLGKKYAQTILKHHSTGQLFATKKDQSESDQSLELDTSKPLYTWDGYNQADQNGQLVYYPTKFDSNNHGGQTKGEMLKKQNQEENAWNILLLENLPNLPRENKGKTIGKRKQLEANQSPKDYLKKLQTDQTYRHESGLTPEDWLTYAVTHLEETNQVIDDYRGNGSISWNMGAYFHQSGNVPNAYWGRDYRQATLYRYGADNRDDDFGLRAAVRV